MTEEEYLLKLIFDTKFKQHEVQKEYRRKRIKKDASFKLIVYLRSRIYVALKRNIKSAHTEELLGCNIEFLKQHLEKQFKVGMSWNNYGKWHVDHIRPCVLFDMSNSEEQHKCFHYSNLQPLWAIENFIKSDKI